MMIDSKYKTTNYIKYSKDYFIFCLWSANHIEQIGTSFIEYPYLINITNKGLKAHVNFQIKIVKINKKYNLFLNSGI